MLFLLYLKRITTALVFAALVSMMAIGGGLPEISMSSFCVSFFVCYLLSQWLLQKIAPGLSQKHKTIIAHILSTMVSIVSLTLLLPHLFLFFNAMPWIVASSILMVTMFIIGFEWSIRAMPKLNLGERYSLTRVILYPKTSIKRFLRMVHPGLEGLQLSPTEKTTLQRRQEAALAQFPAEALIDDMGLYQTYLQAETTSIAEKNRQRTTPLSAIERQMQPLDIKTQALENTRQEATRLADAYAETLTPAQAAAYRHYRELCMQFSPPYAECPNSGESINDLPHEEFVIVEKRSDSNECVPLKTFFWRHTAFKQLFKMKDNFNRSLEPIIPTDRDSIIAPRDENGRPANYVYHVYTTVNNHALSLQLCEAIEKVNRLLQLAPQSKSNSARSASRNPVHGGWWQQFNLFASSPPSSHVDVEVGIVLSR